MTKTTWTPLPANFDFSDKAAWVDHCTDNYAHLTCKACDATESPEGWWTVEGDVNCFDCALSADMRSDLDVRQALRHGYPAQPTDIRKIPTPAQRARLAELDAQGIGAN